jgi:hypothetical protein
MLDQLKSLVKEYSADAIITNPAIPNERNDEAVDLASHSIVDSLKTMVSNGNIGEVQQFFNTGENELNNSPITQNIKGNLVEDLVKKFGLDQGKAAQIASTLIPLVLSKFVKKTNDPADSSFDLSGILGSLTGGGGIGDLLGKSGGNDKDTGGSLMDKVKGMFN